jgi:hypothetical protein
MQEFGRIKRWRINNERPPVHDDAGGLSLLLSGLG